MVKTAVVDRREPPPLSNGITRRGVLAGAIALPWLVACGPGTGTATDPGTRAGVSLEDGTFTSRFWPGQEVHWRLAWPPGGSSGARPPPLVVALHGQGGDAGWPFDSLHIEDHVATTGLALATVDGGDFYWHARKSGIDTGRVVTDELLPLLAAKGIATDRVGLLGWSMGGYGALLLASKIGPTRVAGVAAVSAALWRSYDESFSVAFDDREDFARNDVFAARRKLTGIPLRLDCGLDDMFFEANRAFARELPDAAVTFDAGGHTQDYWTAHAAAQLSWLRDRLR